MAISITKCPIDGLYEIQPEIFEDRRGYFFESWSEKDYTAAGLRISFVQDNQSRSVRGVLRGLHYQKIHPQGKLIQVIEGEIFDVATDLRIESATRGKSHTVILSSEKHNQLYIPPGFAHGFLVLSEFAVCTYKSTDFYYPEDDCGLLWNDPILDIQWPILDTAYILTDKDKNHPRYVQ